MMNFEEESLRLRNIIFQAENNFEEIALDVFRFQVAFNEVYRNYCSLLKKSEVFSLQEIPFLPIEIFKTHSVITGDLVPEKIFRSSGTTGQINSQHFVCDVSLYEESILNAFKKFFGDPRDYCLLALLPSYLERNDASLVYMMNYLMKISGNPVNAFFRNNLSALHEQLKWLEARKQKTILLGVTFGLLDFAEQFPMPLQHTTIIETGGMKGRRREMTREELHDLLNKSFQTKNILSEYGMTELLSQAYLLHDEKFHGQPWMKIFIRDVNDPLKIIDNNQAGAINVIDLANLYSCSFLATSDLGMKFDDDSFVVLGRMDESDVRGCNLMW